MEIYSLTANGNVITRQEKKFAIEMFTRDYLRDFKLKLKRNNMPWFKRKSYNVLKAQSNNKNSNIEKKKTEPVLKRDSRIRSTLTLRFRSYFNKKHS